MSLLYKNLKNIYREKPALEFLSPLEETYLFIRDFLKLALERNNEYVNPSDYSIKYGQDMLNSLNLFLNISQSAYPILSRYYYISCDECDSPTIVSSMNKLYECTHCKYPLDITSDTKETFSNIHYIFKINPEIRKELNYDLKGQPSSSSNFVEEGDQTPYSEAPNLSMLIESQDENYTGVVEEKASIKENLLRFAEGI
ncbi:hypothetical protein H1Q58_08995 [Planococcus maritimus]|uniref:Uncharacterized protein n=1 Tax=Planococcus maritimus TaxID=192421 RepID=A0A7D7RFS8_PLAMR|nr:hypothetical protein [Planococcus maritimus]QMT16123.1 hypothetical protein H1Q58_08995 [Planococcus maritimus]